jgi:hypothetical protein
MDSDEATLARRELAVVNLQRGGHIRAAAIALLELKQLRLYRDGARCRTCALLFRYGNRLCPQPTAEIGALAPWYAIKAHAADYVCADYSVRQEGAWLGW